MLETIEKYVRPMQGAIMLFVLLFGAVISGILELFRPGLGVLFTGGVAGWFRAVPDSYYTLLGGLSGIYMTAKTVERVKSIQATAANDPPARTVVDNPDGGSK